MSSIIRMKTKYKTDSIEGKGKFLASPESHHGGTLRKKSMPAPVIKQGLTTLAQDHYAAAYSGPSDAAAGSDFQPSAGSDTPTLDFQPSVVGPRIVSTVKRGTHVVPTVSIGTYEQQQAALRGKCKNSGGTWVPKRGRRKGYCKEGTSQIHPAEAPKGSGRRPDLQYTQGGIIFYPKPYVIAGLMEHEDYTFDNQLLYLKHMLQTLDSFNVVVRDGQLTEAKASGDFGPVLAQVHGGLKPDGRINGGFGDLLWEVAVGLDDRKADEYIANPSLLSEQVQTRHAEIREIVNQLEGEYVDPEADYTPEDEYDSAADYTYEQETYVPEEAYYPEDIPEPIDSEMPHTQKEEWYMDKTNQLIIVGVAAGLGILWVKSRK